MRSFYIHLSALFFGFVFFAGQSVLLAQEAGERDFPEVNEIRVQFDGFEPVSKSYVLNNVQLRPGMDYNPTLVDQSIRRLYETGYFEFAEVDVDRVEEGLIDVIFRLVPKYTIQRIRYSGNEAYSESRLTSEGEIEAGDILDEFAVSQAADDIQAYYVDKGYPDASVEYGIERNRQTGGAEVAFTIDEGRKVTIKKVNFQGNEAFSDRKLRGVLETKKRNWLSWITGTGKFKASQFEEDLDRLRAFYRSEGYLDVEVTQEDVSFTYPDPNKMEIAIQLEEGRRYSVGEFSVEGATIFTTEELLGAVELEQGDTFSPRKVDAAADAVRDYYTSRGYLDTNVRAERAPNMETGRIDVVFRVRESQRFILESINLEGNTKTKSRVIVRELALSPGEVFDLKRMETSRERLENTRFFNSVRLSPESTNVPGRRDLGITVDEARTGNFSFGVGFGSVEQATLFFELQQGNFDLFNWRSGFQGDGQKFRFRASLGTRSNQLQLSFEEPWLFEQRLAFGVELFRTETDFNSTDFNELRTGFEVYLRRRLFELVEARLSYRLELVEIFDVDRGSGTVNPDGSVSGDEVANVFQAAEGEDLISKIGLSFQRDNRDSLIFTRKGNRTRLISELAGLGGDVNYYKLEGRTAHYIPTYDYLDQSFTILARAGTISPFGDSDEVPFYDRFYLGGPDSLRGFDFRDVGPRDPDDEDESVGGNSYGMISFEYGFRLAEPLGFVVFYDGGFVNEDDFDFGPSDYADNWGFGARILLMGSPLQLDIGFPIHTPEGADDGAQFNFSFGTRF